MKKNAIWWMAGIFLFLVSASEGYADSFSASTDMTISGSERKSSGTKSSSSSLTQNYALGFDKILTRTIKFSGNLRAAKTNTTSGGTSSETTTVRPSLFANMNNDFFRLNGGYQSNFIPFFSLGDQTPSTTINTDLSIPQFKYSPPLRMSYTKTKLKDKLAVHAVHSEQSSVNFSTNYDIFGIGTSYNFSKSKNDDFVAPSQQDSTRQQGVANYSNSLFNNKVNYGLNIGSSLAEQKSVSPTGTSINEEKEASSGLYVESSVPTTGQLSSTPALIDDNTVSSAGITLNDSNRNIGVELKSQESINSIYLYISTSETTIDTSSFGWTAYSSTAASGDLWTSQSVTVTYDSTNKRFEFAFSSDVTASFFKVVNTTFDALADTITVTEIEAIGSTSSSSSTSENTTKRQFAGLNLSWRATKKINTTYNMNYDQSTETDDSTESKNISMGTTMSYVISKKITMFSSLQGQRSTSTGSSDTGSNSYLMSFSTNPIKMINGTISINRTESLQDGSVTTKSNSLNVNTFYKLYPGANLGTGFNANLSESPGTDSKTFASNWNLNLVPWKPLNIVLDGSISRSSTETGGTSSSSISKNARTAITYSPSRHITISSNIELLPEKKQNFSVSTRLPGSLQVSLNYSKSNAGAETISSSASWSISRYIFISASYRKTLLNNAAKDNSSSYNLSFSIRN